MLGHTIRWGYQYSLRYVGLSEGLDDGSFGVGVCVIGNSDGLGVGRFEGDGLGTFVVGAGEGSAVGLGVTGALVGLLEGDDVTGFCVGRAEGSLVVGFSLGCLDGLAVVGLEVVVTGAIIAAVT